MKVRLRLGYYGGIGVGPFEVLEESENFFILGDGSMCVSKKCYEPVPSPDRWQDVSEHIEFGEGPHGINWRHNGINFAAASGGLCDGYRLRKVQVRLAEPKTDGTVKVKGYEQWAFLVEKKASD